MKISAKNFILAAIVLVCLNQVCKCSEQPVPEVQMASFSTFLSTQHAGPFGKLAAKTAANLAKTGIKDAYKNGGKKAITGAVKHGYQHGGKQAIKHGVKAVGKSVLEKLLAKAAKDAEQ